MATVVKDPIQDNYEALVKKLSNRNPFAGGYQRGAIIGTANDFINDILANSIVSAIGTSNLNKAWLIPIIMRQQGLSGLPDKDNTRDTYKKGNEVNDSTTRSLSQGDQGTPYGQVKSTIISNGGAMPSEAQIEEIKPKAFPSRVIIKGNNPKTNDYIDSTTRGVPTNFLYNIKKEQESLYPEIKNDIIIVNLDARMYLTIQNRPNELRIEPTSSWVSVKSMGRNNPFMIYTGSEDTISFETSWYSNDPSRYEDVVTKCKLLESWTKADGYISGPPLLQIIWGNSGLFQDDYFILYSAPYVLKNFNDKAVGEWGMKESKMKLSTSLTPDWVPDPPSSGLTLNAGDTSFLQKQVVNPLNNNSDSQDFNKSITYNMKNKRLLPSVATQTLTFKRVTGNNYTHTQILNRFSPVGINGINIV